ncbi:MAG: type III pantothenate kinase [Candidatus Eisenbacteria bacterium]|uniref:Type III pantothenate kinase n=1 Tax=Eiseniibacteriota bacterium TaxID=2212470 RepID=A0A9D6LAZ9_UNCEI|nr:type III pantothenate kinase [Candidatus Eisenbacteria bacterium]MBI3540250.1 type III pantothenate kinase [Candidatus Eisenbacteria bacterium]
MRKRSPRRRGAKGALVAVDIGNSDTVIGLFRERDLAGFWRVTTRTETGDELRLRLDGLARAHRWPRDLGAVMCSVVPALTLPWLSALTALSGRAPIEVNATTATTLPIRYHDRTAVGADRIANAIAARALYGTPAIVVDLGTATTFDCISAQGAYLGGVIAPGVASSADELFRRAARLARVELRRPARVLGRTTEESLQAGLIWGAAGQVDALVRRLALEMKGTPTVIATGGLATVIAPECETINRVDEALTLKGMRLIWEEHA